MNQPASTERKLLFLAFLRVLILDPARLIIFCTDTSLSQNTHSSTHSANRQGRYINAMEQQPWRRCKGTFDRRTITGYTCNVSSGKKCTQNGMHFMYKLSLLCLSLTERSFVKLIEVAHKKLPKIT